MHIIMMNIDYFIEAPEFAIGGDHEIVATKELKDNYIKVESSIVCHDGESIQVNIHIIYTLT